MNTCMIYFSALYMMVASHKCYLIFIVLAQNFPAGLCGHMPAYCEDGMILPEVNPVHLSSCLWYL